MKFCDGCRTAQRHGAGSPAARLEAIGWSLTGKRYLIVDRDALFSEQFGTILKRSGTTIVRTSVQAPNINAFAERFVLSLESEYLDRMVLVGGDSLDRAIREVVIHYQAERPHQGLDTPSLKYLRGS